MSNEGSKYYESPHIDRIAREGMKFTRGYAACQVCSPSRASIMTGKYPTNHGITTWIGDRAGRLGVVRVVMTHLPPEYDRALRALRDHAGRGAAGAGLQDVLRRQMAYRRQGLLAGGSRIRHQQRRVGCRQPAWWVFSPWINPTLESGPPGESLPIRLGNETAKFIEAHKDKPFLAFLSFYSVHGPIQTTPGLWKKYRDKAESAGLAKERFKFDRRLNVRQVQDCPIYAGMIETMDDAVGIVLDKLDELGLDKNTIVCFTSDNGGVSSGDAYSTSNTPLRGSKGRQWEGGIREPYYIKAPGVTEPGGVSAVPVNGIDWYPTLLEMAGVNVPAKQAVDGVSIVPLLKGGKIAKRPLYWHYPHYGNQGGEPSSIISQNDWKLIHYHEDGRDELYHLANDPNETTDLAKRETKHVKQLRKKLDAWLKETKARFPTKDTQADLAKREARLKSIASDGKARLEKQHANFLKKDFKPNKDWWGSARLISAT